MVLGIPGFGLGPWGEEGFGFEGVEEGEGRRGDETRDDMSHTLSASHLSHFQYLISVDCGTNGTSSLISR